MNRSDLIWAVAETQKMKQTDVERILDGLLKVIEVSLACGEPVTIARFGKFEPRTRRPVTRRNLNTGEEIKVPEKTTVLFHAAPALKERVNKSVRQPALPESS